MLCNGDANQEGDIVAAGWVLHFPVERGAEPQSQPLVVDQVRHCGDEVVYCFRDSDGPAICIRASRLAKLGLRLQPQSHD